jgi:hypothetical protein
LRIEAWYYNSLQWTTTIPRMHETLKMYLSLKLKMVVANMFHFLIGIFIEKTLHVTMPRYEQQH